MKTISLLSIALLLIACEFTGTVQIDENCPAAIPVVRFADVDSLANVGTLNPLCPYAYIDTLGDTVIVRPVPEIN